VVAVGAMHEMTPWMQGRQVTVDRQFEDKVLMPGLIDNHIHPFLGALLMPMVIIAPEAWRQPNGNLRPAARTQQAYRDALMREVDMHMDRQEWFITWGYQPDLHGRYDRKLLDEMFPDRPVILWHRSFHETYLNTCAIEKLNLQRQDWVDHPQIEWERGRFFETGFKPILLGLLPYFMRPQWYYEGLRQTVQLMQMGGITTGVDMLFGALAPEYERAALEQVLHKENAPCRMVNVFDIRGYANRASQQELGPPEQTIDFEVGLGAIDEEQGPKKGKIWAAKAVKLFADGAMFSQLMQMRWPGYLDGHQGEWLMAPPVLKAGVLAAWKAGYTIHVHVNGDGGMDSVLDAVETAQTLHPRFDHRFHVHHVGFHAQSQTARMAALGIHASVNPYYLHALGDHYGMFGLGPERASQLTRIGSMLKQGMRVSFHSDFMMAPTEPLTLAWCAASRTTQGGQVLAPAEKITLMQALRAVTVDAAWALRLEDEIGSIAAGKRADFVVLADDPLTFGPERLREVRIAGTIFEGDVHLLPVAVNSSLLNEAMAVAKDDVSVASKGRYRAVSGHCNGVADRCDLVRTWSLWLQGAVAQALVPVPQWKQL
jgi:predicted amidohydrolase YtcJ